MRRTETVHPGTWHTYLKKLSSGEKYYE